MHQVASFVKIKEKKNIRMKFVGLIIYEWSIYIGPHKNIVASGLFWHAIAVDTLFEWAQVHARKISKISIAEKRKNISNTFGVDQEARRNDVW